MNRFEQFKQDVQEEPTVTTNRFTKLENRPSVVQEIEEQGAAWYEDPVNASRMFLKGMTFDWSDEIGSAAATLMVMGHGLIDESLVEGKSMGDIYDEIHGQIRKEEEAYQAAHPTASTVLEVGGAFASPANYVGLGAASKSGTMLTSAQKAAGMTGRGALEGALYGAGSNEDNRLSGAQTGAAYGAAAGAAFGTVGWLWGNASQRRIAADLGKGDNFKPITLAANSDEKMLGEIYRDVVGASYGGAALAKQEVPYLAKAADKVTKRQSVLDQSIGFIDDSIKQAKKKIETGNIKLDRLTVDQIDGLKLAAKQGDDVAKDFMKNIANKTKAAAAAQVDDAVQEGEQLFRMRIMGEAMPAGASRETMDAILNAKTPQASLKLLNDTWAREGFQSIKGRKFQVNANSIRKEIESRVADDIKIVGKAEGTRVLNQLTNWLDEKTVKGWIDGEDLSAIRSRLGTYAGSKSDTPLGMLEQTIFRNMQDVLNNKVKSSLSGDRLKAFNKDVSAWGTQTMLRDAITAASKKAGTQGRFTPDQWLAAAAKNSKKAVQEGTAPFQKEADQLVKQAARRDELVTRTADDIVRSEENRMAKAATKRQADLAAEVKRLQRAKEDVKRSNLDRLQRFTEEAKLSDDIKKAEAALQQAKNEASDLMAKSATRSHEGSIFKRMVAMNVAAPDILPSSGAAKLGGALLTTSGAATQTGQRLIAGQTSTQQAMAKVTEAARKNVGKATDVGQMLNRFTSKLINMDDD